MVPQHTASPQEILRTNLSCYISISMGSIYSQYLLLRTPPAVHLPNYDMSNPLGDQKQGEEGRANIGCSLIIVDHLGLSLDCLLILPLLRRGVANNGTSNKLLRYLGSSSHDARKKQTLSDGKHRTEKEENKNQKRKEF